MPKWALRSHLREDQNCDHLAKKEQQETPERELKAHHFEYRKLSERERHPSILSREVKRERATPISSLEVERERTKSISSQVLIEEPHLESEVGVKRVKF